MTINVTKYRLNPDRVFAGTSGSFGMEKLSFNFDDSWDFDTISVTFHPQRGKPIRVPYLIGAEIDIPAEVMAHSGESRFVVSGILLTDTGTEIERRMVSLEGIVAVEYTTPRSPCGNTKKVTPDTYDLFLSEATGIFEGYRMAVNDFADKAAESQRNAADSEKNAKLSEEKAAASETAAKSSETNAMDAARRAAVSEGNAADSERNAMISMDSADASAKSAGNSAVNAGNSEFKASVSAQNAVQSAADAQALKEAAKTSANNAAVSETNAKTSETNAASSAASVAANLEESKRVLAGVNTAGEAQVKAVQDEGAAQIKAVGDAAEAKKTEISGLDAVQFDVEQSKTDAQKAQARTNMGAAAQEDVDSLLKAIGDLKKNTAALDSEDAELIPASSDANTYMTPGNYKVNSTSVAETIANLPEKISGRMTVYESYMTNRLLQTFVTSTSVPRLYVRSYNGSKWYGWEKIITASNLDEILKNTAALDSEDAELIPANSDVNTYITPGNYKVNSAAVAETIANLPEKISGRMTVYESYMTNRLLQTFVTSTSVPRLYVRSYNGSDWYSWEKIITASNVAEILKNSIVSSNILITPNNYTEYFTDYNDIPVNTVYSIAQDVPLLNSPPGNNLVDRAGETSGYMPGTVLTCSGNSTTVRARFQIFFGQTSMQNQSVMCFRSGYPSDGVIKWYPWQTFSDRKALTATNIAVRKEIAQEVLPDMDNAEINSIYQIDLDCDEGTILNHPNPGQSCVLITFGFSHTSRHGMVQMCFGVGGATKMFYRYGYKQSSTEYRWTAWERVLTESTGSPETPETPETSDYLVNMGRLPDGSDLNNITGNCYYLVGDYAGNQNVPTEKAGFITSKHVKNIILQTFEALTGERYSRYAVADKWYDWVEG